MNRKDGSMKSELLYSGRLTPRIMKRIVLHSALIFSMVFTLLLLPAGCSSEQGGDKHEDEAFMQKYEAPAKKLEHISLKFYFPGEEPKRWPEVKAEIEKRSLDSVNASLDFKWFDYGRYISVMRTLDASGLAFDAFCVSKPESIFPNFTTLAKEGMLTDITALFPENAQALYSRYKHDELEYAKVDGKLYAIPALYPDAYCSCLKADDTLCTKYNISKITNLDQYEAYLKAVKDNEPQLIPGIITIGVNSMKLFAGIMGYTILDEYQNLVYKRDDPKMKIKAWEQTPEFLELANKLIEWYRKGYLKFDADPAKVTSFVLFGELEPLPEEPQRMSLPSESGEFIQSNPLRVFNLYSGQKAQRDNPMGSSYETGALVFPSSSSNTARALRFLDWVQQDRDNYYLMMYGIENEDYVLKDNHLKLPQGVDFDSTYMNWDGSRAFRNVEYEPSPRKDAYGPGINSHSDFIDRYTELPPHGAFYPDYSKLKDAAEKRINAIIEFDTSLLKGEIKDFGEVTKFIDDMKALGIDNLVARTQTQLDKWIGKAPQ
ncbi:MAG TPA: DUF3502 domain-containing protein [Clostridia bacterium]|nr:DUF3502 domain-containing protein [Clostridia bacterium]